MKIPPVIMEDFVLSQKCFVASLELMLFFPLQHTFNV